MSNEAGPPGATSADPAMESLASDLVGALAYPQAIVDLFWEEQRAWRLEIGGMAGQQGELHLLIDEDAGASLRCVTTAATRFAWAGEYRLQPLVESFDELSGTNPTWPTGAQKRLPPCPSRRSWADLIRALRADLPHPAHVVHLSLATVVIDGMRGVCPRAGHAVEWPVRHTALRLRAIRSDGTVLVSEQVVEPQLANSVEAAGERFGLLLRDDPKQGGGMEGAMPVVTAAGSGAVLYHELIGHPLEADFAPNSRLVGLTESLAMHQELSIEDRPEAIFGPGAIVTDDEGEAAVAAPLVREGRVCGRIHDRRTATNCNRPTTGTGRRQDYRHAPAPRMRNIVISPGTTAAGTMLAGIRDGILVERFGVGQVEPESGRFVLRVERAVRILHGNPAEVVRNVRITGLVGDALRGLEAIGDDYLVSPEVVPCEKAGVVLTGVAGPSIRINELNVSPH